MENRPTLLQEDHINKSDGPWRVLIICELLNLTSYVQAEPSIDKLFDRWPTAQDFISAVSQEDKNYFKELLQPLGLWVRRYRYVIDTTYMYLQDKERFGEDYKRYKVSKYPGCGPYAQDAWTLFVLRERCNPSDGRLKDYVDRYYGFPDEGKAKLEERAKDWLKISEENQDEPQS